MKKILGLLLLLGLFFGLTSSTIAAVRVRGYYRSNGTYVQPHYRSNPDSYRFNNYSSYGNYNPYTGSTGRKSYWDY